MPLKIIYVDDEPELLELFEEEFASDEIQIQTFTDPNQAIQEIAANPPDLLFLDFQLPGITGEQIALSLDPKIPKFLISGNLNPKPFDCFIKVFEKPINFPEIRKVIESYLKA